MTTQERIVEVMGTTAHVIITDGPPGLADRAAARLEELEARWSRFRPDSEISRLNEMAEVPVIVSPETYHLVERALEGWRLTAGRFDPTLLRELRAAGYDRSFELIAVGDGANGPIAAAMAAPSHAQRGKRRHDRSTGQRSSARMACEPCGRYTRSQQRRGMTAVPRSTVALQSDNLCGLAVADASARRAALARVMRSSSSKRT
jgi:hypothetical protein